MGFVCRFVLHLWPADWFAHLDSVIHHHADLLALVEQMRLRAVRVAAQPERDVERRVDPAVHGVFGVVDVSDRQIPVVVNIIDTLARGIRTVGVRARLPHFHPTGENRRVGALLVHSAL